MAIYRYAKSSTWKKEFEALQQQLSLPLVVKDSSGVDIAEFAVTGSGSVGRRLPIWRCPVSGLVLRNVSLSVGTAYTGNASNYFKFAPVLYTTRKAEAVLGTEQTTQRRKLAAYGTISWDVNKGTLNAGEIVAMRVRWIGSPAALYGLFLTADFER